MHNEQSESASWGIIPRSLGPEHFDLPTQTLSSREAILKSLKGEGQTDPQETAFQQEQKKIQEVLQRAFDTFKQAILESNSYPELIVLAKTCQEMWDFPNRDQASVKFVLEREDAPVSEPLYTGATDSELPNSGLSPKTKKAWHELAEVWQRVREKSAGFAFPDMSEAISSFEGKQLVETFALIQERAQAITLIENHIRTFEQKAKEEATELFTPPLSDMADLWKNLVWRWTTGSWKKNDDGTENFTWMNEKNQDFFELCREADRWTTMDAPTLEQVFDTFWNVYFSKMDAAGQSSVSKTFVDGFMSFYNRLLESPKSSEPETSAQSQLSHQPDLATLQAHLKPDQVYTLPDGTFCYWGFTTTGERIILPVSDPSVRLKTDRNPTLHYFYRQGVVEVSLSQTVREVQHKLHETALQEGFTKLKYFSREASADGIIRWLENERNWFEDTWAPRQQTSRRVKDALSNREIDQWWKLYKVAEQPDTARLSAIFEGRLSVIKPTQDAVEWVQEISLEQDLTEEDRRAVRYLKLVSVLKQMVYYPLPTLQEKLGISSSPDSFTQELLDCIQETVLHLESGLHAPFDSQT